MAAIPQPGTPQMIWFFSLSIIFLGWVKARKNITILGPFGFFVIYQIIYNFTPWLTASFGIFLFPLSRQEDLLSIQLLLASLSNIAFGTVYLLSWTPTSTPMTPMNKYRGNPQILFWSVYVPTLFMVQNYGWNNFSQVIQAGGSPSIMNSLASFMKLFLIASFIHCLILHRFSKSNNFILLALVILLFVDGARTNFMMIIALCFFYIYDGGKRKLNWRYALGGLSVLLAFVLSRSLRLEKDFTQNIIETFIAEGVTGSYMNLQTIYILKYHSSIPLTFGQNYLIDPFVSLTPFASIFRGSLENWIDAITPYLTETYAPAGGFYYMAEALASFGWIGPPVITGLYAAVIVRLNNRIKAHQSIYLLFLASFGCLFSKTQFLNCFKLFVLISISFFLIQKILVTSSPALSKKKEPE